MYSSIVKSIIKENQREIPQINIFKRDIELDDSSSYIFEGLRYVGKSFLMFQHIQSLIKRGKASIDDILYINFDDERLVSIAEKHLNQIITNYKELHAGRQPIIFLDEIQRVDGWVNFAYRLAEAGYRVFITVSNAQVLKDRSALKLKRHYAVQHIHSFSISEYLKVKGEEISTEVSYIEYLNYGGFAESFNVGYKRDWINALYQKVLLEGVVKQSNLIDAMPIRALMRKIAESVTQPLTQYRLQQITKLSGVEIPLSRVSYIMSAMQDSYLLFGFSNYASLLTHKGKFQKYYLNDNGLLNIFLTNRAQEYPLLENLVAIELAKRYGKEQVFYYQHHDVAVDFYMPQRNLAIQITHDISSRCDENSPEVKAFVEFNARHNVDRAIVVTLEESKVIEVGDLTIECIPIWRWLL
ncbi:MAG: ATP-binding protein [Rikenellaceae bacterium]